MVKVLKLQHGMPSYHQIKAPLHATKELTKGKKHKNNQTAKASLKTIKPQRQARTAKKIRHLLVWSPVGIVVEGQLNLLGLPA